MTDKLKKYLLPEYGIRLEAVRLSNSWTEGLKHQNLPKPVYKILGEMVAASTLLAANLKFDGSVVLQIQGDGPVSLLVVECTSKMQIRASASLKDDYVINGSDNLQSLMNTNQNGRFIVVLDPRSGNKTMQPYQGIVPLESDTVAQALEQYMQSSEQLDTKLWLNADQQQCAGLLLQRLPNYGGKAQSQSDTENQYLQWEEVNTLLQTLDNDELLNTDSDTLVHRFLWQHEYAHTEDLDIKWHCPCSRDRVANMLKMLGTKEIESILSDLNQVSVACNFCGKPYVFDAIDCATIFSSNNVLSQQTIH